MLREGVALGRALARKARHGRGLGHRLFGGDLIFGSGRLQLLEGQLHLVDQSN
jgi:hypothetical protein